MSQELENAFRKFAVYGNSKATGNEMTGKNFSKLCKECNIQENGCTSTDVDIVFAKVKGKAAHVITYGEFQKALELLSEKRFQGQPASEAIAAIHKLVEAKEPASMGTTKAVTAGAVDRLTDTSKYTGSHKERFDESGKGKGLAGREELTDGSGYVGAYKGAGTCDKKTKK
ncbi:tubulin polymerization-promoting protein family member 2 [Bufo bufo]|uniref:tubulin polymerization-promoting protein family member 2 n=1 Tax=Bufo bufo TaxID=8384 RepID=UPI001ABECACD|nr:tubulin polymerization-promoting protein family member 2 [Bufo bufo]XP_040272671.1 tubulin polymerization-promoting protein family member 2 [Bufo bufo]